MYVSFRDAFPKIYQLNAQYLSETQSIDTTGIGLDAGRLAVQMVLRSLVINVDFPENFPSCNK